MVTFFSVFSFLRPRFITNVPWPEYLVAEYICLAVPELSLFVACSSEIVVQRLSPCSRCPCLLLHAAGVRDGHRCQHKQCHSLPFESQLAVERDGRSAPSCTACNPCLSLDLTMLSVFFLGAPSGFFSDLLHWFGLMALASGCVFIREQVLAC